MNNTQRRILVNDTITKFLFYRCFRPEAFPELIDLSSRHEEYCNETKENIGDVLFSITACCRNDDFCNDEQISFPKLTRDQQG